MAKLKILITDDCLDKLNIEHTWAICTGLSAPKRGCFWRLRSAFISVTSAKRAWKEIVTDDEKSFFLQGRARIDLSNPNLKFVKEDGKEFIRK